ncbi:DNA polymerase III subunit delta [Chitinasiproducens palmae]|uniref:DNA polymerase III subunit delta n=1 Tax=Chitinasiproducens palmae TaxID=1770053 RepID=A0A1H2PSF9_9BURK|nr:DNA polymerase III subunit delta [Chitinasiproducens palmae]SDV49518.1 DNA polymerase III, delta subunit [Chitinasiproducens palmae]
MLLRADALPAHLAKALRPLYVVFGDEHLLVQESVDAIRQAARAAGCTERETFVAERGFDWSALLGASQAMSLFGEKRLVELRVPSGKPGREGGEALQTLARQSGADPNTVMLVTLPRLDASTQKSAWFTALTTAGVGVRIDVIERANLGNWIGERLARQRQRVPAGEAGRRALQFIVERVEGNLLAAHQEILKLGLLYPPGEIDDEQVREAVLNVARYDVFKLNEAMLAGDVARLARMVDGLRGEGETPILVLWAVVEEIRTLIRVKRGLAAGRSLAELARANRVWGPRERFLGQAVRRVELDALEGALADAARLDAQLKGLGSGMPPGQLRAGTLPASPDPWQGLFDLAMRVAAEPASSARRQTG